MSAEASVHASERAAPRLAGMIGAAAFLLVTCSTLACFGRFAWWLDLLAHFRPHYVVCALGLSAGSWLAGGKRAGAVLLVAAALNAIPVAPALAPRPEPPAGPSWQLIAANVLTHGGDADALGALIRAEAPHFVALQEVDHDFLDRLAPALGDFPHRIAEPRGDNFGIALYSRIPWSSAELVRLSEADVPSILARLSLGGSEVTLLVTHPVPPIGGRYAAWRDAQLAAIPAYANAGNHGLVVGDLNTTPWGAHFIRLRERSGLSDSRTGFGIAPTWPAGLIELGIPIDHVLHAPSILITRREVGPNYGSDHLPLIVEFQRAS